MGASSGILTINGRDIDDLDLVLLDLGSPYGGIEYDRGTAQPFGSAGAYPTAEATVSPRVLTFESALDATVSNRRSRLDEVRRHLQGVLEIVLEDDATRAIYGRIERSPGRPRFPQNVWSDGTADPALTLEVTCYNPFWQDLNGRVISFGTTATEIPLGTAPSPPVIYIPGAISNPKVTYRGLGGTELASMNFNGLSVASDEALILDMRTLRVVLEDYGADTRTTSLADLDSGWFFSLDPGDGERAGGTWPTLEMSSGTAECHYRRYWIS